MFDLNKLKSVDKDSLKSFYANLTNLIKHGETSDLNEDDLYQDLRMLRDLLPTETKRAIDVLNYIKDMDGCYPNAWIAYRILLTMPITVAYAEIRLFKVEVDQILPSINYVARKIEWFSMISIENDMVGKLDYVSLISTFVSKNARLVLFQ